MATALMILANGFEEIEALSVVDILRRAHVQVEMAGLESKEVKGSHEICVKADVVLSEVLDRLYDVVILPGGEPGTTHLQNSPLVERILQNHRSEQKKIAAICAAPRILDQMGFLNGKQATSFPGTRPMMRNCLYQEAETVWDDPILTSRGPGTAMAFGFAIVEQLVSWQMAQDLKSSMVYSL